MKCKNLIIMENYLSKAKIQHAEALTHPYSLPLYVNFVA